MNKKSVLVMLIICFVLGHIPFMFAPFVNFESWYADAAKLLNQGKFIEGTRYLDLAVGNPITSVMGILTFYKILGISEFTTRLFSLFCGTLAIIVIYCIGKRYYGEKNAFWASIFAAVNPILWLYSGIVGTDIPFLFLTSLAMYLLLLGIRTNLYWQYLLSGIVFGAAFLFKFNLIAFIPVILTILLLKPLLMRKFHRSEAINLLKVLIIYVISMAVIISPLVWWACCNLGYLINPGQQQAFGINSLSALLSDLSLKAAHLGGYLIWIGIFAGPLFLFVFGNFAKRLGFRAALLFSIAIISISWILVPIIYNFPYMNEVNAGWLEFITDGIGLMLIKAWFMFSGITVVTGLFLWAIESEKMVSKYLAIWFFILLFVYSLVKPSQRYLLFILPPLYLYLSEMIIISILNNYFAKRFIYIFIIASLLLFASFGVFNSYYFATEGYVAKELAQYVNNQQLKITYGIHNTILMHSGYLIDKKLFVYPDDKDITAGVSLVTLRRTEKMNNIVKEFKVELFGVVFKRYAIIK